MVQVETILVAERGSENYAAEEMKKKKSRDRVVIEDNALVEIVDKIGEQKLVKVKSKSLFTMRKNNLLDVLEDGFGRSP